MDLLSAHGRFIDRYESGEYAPFADIPYEPIDDVIQPAMMCAAVSLSGRLDQCRDDDDLDDAVRHFLVLHESGVVSLDEWKREIHRVVDEICQWAEAANLN